MPLSETEYASIRFITGTTEATLPNEILDMLFNVASDTYAAYSRGIWIQAILVSWYQNRVATYRTDVTYKQNETSENLTDIAKGYALDLENAKKELEDLIAAEKTVALRTTTIKKIPSRIRSFPNG